jgi:hypothetical protein
MVFLNKSAFTSSNLAQLNVVIKLSPLSNDSIQWELSQELQDMFGFSCSLFSLAIASLFLVGSFPVFCL